MMVDITPTLDIDKENFDNFKYFFICYLINSSNLDGEIYVQLCIYNSAGSAFKNSWKSMLEVCKNFQKPRPGSSFHQPQAKAIKSIIRVCFFFFLCIPSTIRFCHEDYST